MASSSAVALDDIKDRRTKVTELTLLTPVTVGVHGAPMAYLLPKGCPCCYFALRIKLQKEFWRGQVVKPWLQWPTIHQLSVHPVEHLKQ